jgi:hypothetical protein
MNNWKEFIKAGNAIFTIENNRTGGWFTYKVRKHKEKDLWFVMVLTGPDNTSNYTYLGTIFENGFRLTRKSRFGKESSSYKVFDWLMRIDELPGHIVVNHCGRCGRCGRLLTVPESVVTGFGPECAGRMNLPGTDTVDCRKLRAKVKRLKHKLEEAEK